VKAAEVWLNGRFAEVGERQMELYGIFRHLTTARALMILGEAEEARRFLRRLEKLAEDFGRVIDKAEAMTLLAILEWHRGSKSKAAAVLEEAVASVARYRYVRVFADEGKSILPALYALQENVVSAVLMDEIRAAAAKRAQKRAGVTAAFPASTPRLTKREAQMLRYLADGWERGAMASDSHLSLNTIKFHIKRLYRKLDAHSTADAVNKSREIGLI
jgi:LuxR family maltose regulon positive regulatory protein